jgi:uncharacterized membrane protein YkoI
MRNTFTKIVLAALSLIIPNLPAAIASPTVAPALVDNEPDVDLSVAREVERELQRFRSARVPLRQALDIAERLHAGSRTADISFDGKGDVLVFHVKTVKDQLLWENTIDALSGTVIGDEVASSLSALDDDDQLDVVALNGVRQNLSDAVFIAESSTSGKAISGGLKNEGGKLNFIIVVVADDELKQVVLEPPRAKIRRSPPRGPR